MTESRVRIWISSQAHQVTTRISKQKTNRARNKTQSLKSMNWGTLCKIAGTKTNKSILQQPTPSCQRLRPIRLLASAPMCYEHSWARMRPCFYTTIKSPRTCWLWRWMISSTSTTQLLRRQVRTFLSLSMLSAPAWRRSLDILMCCCLSITCKIKWTRTKVTQPTLMLCTGFWKRGLSSKSLLTRNFIKHVAAIKPQFLETMRN